MPYQSAAQARLFHAKAKNDPEWAARAAHWDAATHAAKVKGKLKKLPDKVSKASKKEWAIGLGTATAGGALANQIPRINAKHLKRKKKGKVSKLLAPQHPEDDFYNHAAAQKAFDLVMKMDDDTARMFTTIVVQEIFDDTVEKNYGTVQRHLDEVIAKRIDDLKRAHLRLVSKGYDENDSVAYAQAMALIEKRFDPISKIGAAQKHGYVWQESDFRRDPGSGQFATKISRNQTKLLRGKTEREILGTETPKEWNGQKLDEEDRVRFQDEYRQVGQFLEAVKQSTGGKGNQSVMMHYRNVHTGKDHATLHFGNNPPTQELLDPNTRLVGIAAKPETLTAGGAAFGLATALGGDLNPRQVKGINAADQGGNKFANDWLSAGEDKNTNRRLYDRLHAGGKFTTTIAPAGSKAHLAGKFAEIIGNHGPEAEAVLGPTARKTAYRYRGTEKTPDKRMVAAYDRGITQGKKLRLAVEPEEELRRGAKAGRSLARPQPGVAPPVHRIAAQRAADEDRAPNWVERGPGRQAIIESLQQTRERGGKFPSKKLYGLQLASGNTPPSEGVIINADGQIATQAVGYGDDHYLPFNLKNLKALKGGEYIRTRSVGGLTSEDIYAGLISGARQVTVTSRSGTYTMTFEQDFRGGRRHNDKARRMTRRYEQLLDAVQSEQVQRGEIDDEMRIAIENEVKQEMAGKGWRPADIQETIRERIEEFKENPYISEDDEARAEAIINSKAPSKDDKSPRAVKARAKIRNEVYDDLLDAKETRFRLNSEGYRAALFSLEEQFPYYITSRYTPARSPEQKISPERDKGYVEPGRNRPTAASAGLYGTRKGASGKFSAAEADYQGVRAVARGGSAKVAKPEDEEGKDRTEGGKPTDVHAERRKAAAEAALAASVIETAAEVQMHARNKLEPQDLSDRDIAEAVSMTQDELRDPGNQAKFAKWAERFFASIEGTSAANPNLRRKWETAVGHRERKPFDRETIGTWPKQPPTFTGDAYEAGAKWRDVKREILKNDKGVVGVVDSIPYSRLSEDRMRKEHEALVQMHSMLSQNPITLNVDDIKEAGADPQSPGLGKLRSDPDKVLERIELLQKQRALTSGLKPEQRTELDEETKVVEVNETPTSAEQAEPRQKMQTNADFVLRVVNAMEKDPNHDPDVADQLRGYAAAMENELPNINTQAAVDAFSETHKKESALLTTHAYEYVFKPEAEEKAKKPPES